MARHLAAAAAGPGWAVGIKRCRQPQPLDLRRAADALAEHEVAACVERPKPAGVAALPGPTEPIDVPGHARRVQRSCGVDEADLGDAVSRDPLQRLKPPAGV